MERTLEEIKHDLSSLYSTDFVDAKSSIIDGNAVSIDSNGNIQCISNKNTICHKLEVMDRFLKNSTDKIKVLECGIGNGDLLKWEISIDLIDEIIVYELNRDLYDHFIDTELGKYIKFGDFYKNIESELSSDLINLINYHSECYYTVSEVNKLVETYHTSNNIIGLVKVILDESVRNFDVIEEVSYGKISSCIIRRKYECK